MSNRFSAIGFPVGSVEDAVRAAEAALRYGHHVEAACGAYVCWPVGRGAELWVQLDDSEDVVGLHPHFAGPARLRIGVEELSIAGPRSMDGRLRGWADAPPGQRKTGCYPLQFDLPDAQTLAGLKLPAWGSAQVSAFAYTLAVFEDEADYLARQQPGQTVFAVESFIPGSAIWEGAPGESPPSEAFLSGRVVQADLIENRHTHRPFWWATVRSYGGQYDVVADPALVEQPLKRDAVVQGTFWLSGRWLGHGKVR